MNVNAEFIESGGKLYVGYEIKNEDDVFEARLLVNRSHIEKAAEDARNGNEMTREEFLEACEKSSSES